MVALVIAYMNASNEAFLVPVGLLAMIISVLVAFWFASIADHIKKDAVARAKEDFVRERENLLVSAEAEKRSVLEESHKRIVKETNQVHAKANFKLGGAFIGVLSFATVMISIELLTVGLLTLATAGGALAGYVIRARQDALSYRGKVAKAALESRTPIHAELISSSKADAKKLVQKR